MIANIRTIKMESDHWATKMVSPSTNIFRSKRGQNQNDGSQKWWAYWRRTNSAKPVQYPIRRNQHSLCNMIWTCSSRIILSILCTHVNHSHWSIRRFVQLRLKLSLYAYYYVIANIMTECGIINLVGAVVKLWHFRNHLTGQIIILWKFHST